jgi:hypothetical protein
VVFETKNVMAWTAVKDAVFPFLNFISFDIFISTKKNSPPPIELPFDHDKELPQKQPFAWSVRFIETSLFLILAL